MKATVAAAMAVLIVVAGVAGYWTYLDQSATPRSTASPVFNFTQAATFSYVAQLTNNSLYSVNNLTDPNQTLFYQITSWLNVSFQYTLATDRPVNASTSIEMPVELRSDAWSRPLGATDATASVQSSESSAVVVVYRLNVTGIVALTSEIANQTGYTPDSYQVLLSPLVVSEVHLGAQGTVLDFNPALALNFTSQMIVPTGLSSSHRGQYAVSGSSSPSGLGQSVYVPLAALVALLAGVVALGYGEFFRDVGHRRPDLESRLRPYEQAIARTGSPPPAGTLVNVPEWEDLVKVADTIGRPILRYRSDAGPFAGSMLFYVLADSASYVYEYRPAGEEGGRGPAPKPATPAELDRALTAPARGLRSARDRRALQLFVHNAAQVRDELGALDPTDADRLASEALLLRAIGLARDGRFYLAWRLLDEASFRAHRTPPAPPIGTGVGPLLVAPPTEAEA